MLPSRAMRSRSFKLGLAVALSGLVAHGALAPATAWAADEADEADEAEPETKAKPPSSGAANQPTTDGDISGSGSLFDL